MIKTIARWPIAHPHFLRTVAIGVAALSSLTEPHALATRDGFSAMVAAERSFASDARRIGITAAFRAHVARDGILLRPAPGPAAALLAAQRDEDGDSLEWRPAIAAIARSNDLGFTTGPYHFRTRGKLLAGHFVTIWQRDPEGRWRWYLDHGLPGVEVAEAAPLPNKVRRLRAGTPPAAGRARPDLVAAEDALNAALVEKGADALTALLAEDGQVLRPRHEPAGIDGAGAMLASEPPVVRAERQGMRLSRAGDFAASYGRIDRKGGQRPAFYVRVWRLDAAGWCLLIDEVV
jgi:hypothetical protein